MESLVVLFALALVGTLLLLPFVALGMAHGARRKVEQLEAMLKLTERRAEDAFRQASAVDARLTAWVIHFQHLVEAQQSASDTQQAGAPASEVRDATTAGAPPVAVSPHLENVGAQTAAVDPSVATVDQKKTATTVSGNVMGHAAADDPSVAAVDPSGTTVDQKSVTPAVDENVAAHAAAFDPSVTPAVDENVAAHAAAFDVASSPHVSSLVGVAASLPAPGPIDSSDRVSAADFNASSGERRAFDWERLVGVRLFAWLGGGALFLAAALFMQYTIQHNLVSPTIRVASGLLLGSLSVYGGSRIRARASLAGDAISGAGVAILYAAIFAAHSIYDLIGTAPAAVGMALVTVTAGVLAVRQSAYIIAFLGLLGGMSTPYLLSTGHDRALALFLYVAALSSGVVYVSRRKEWYSLGILGLLGACVLFLGWAGIYLDARRSAYALFALTVIAAIYAMASRRSTEAAASTLGPILGVSAVLVPLVAAVAIGTRHELDLPPFALALHLVAVSALAWFVSGREAIALSPVTAGACVFAWMARLDVTLLTHEAHLTYGAMLLVPVVHALAWWIVPSPIHRNRLYPGLLVLLAGAAPIVLVARSVATNAPFHTCLGFTAIHATILVAMAWTTRRGLPLALAQIVMFLAIACDLVTAIGVTSELGIATIASGSVFFALPLAHARLRSTALGWVGGALALPLHFALLYVIAVANWGRPYLGGIALGAAALEVAALALVQTWEFPSRLGPRRVRALYGGTALALLTCAIPILLDNEWLTVSWALEALALCWLFQRVEEPGLLWTAAALALGVAIRLLFNPALYGYHLRTATPLWNHYLYTFGVPIAAFITAARMMRHDAVARKLRLSSGFGFVATVLLFMLLNVEIADYFSTGANVTFPWDGSGGLAQDMTYSIGWGAFGTGLLSCGILLRIRAARVGALAVLSLTIGKVCLHDLWALGSLYRVGSIVGLALALLGVSYLTQRFVLPKERP